MSLRGKIVLLGAGVLAVPVIELGLNGLGVALLVRVLFLIVAVSGLVLSGFWLFQRVFADLEAIQRAIDETARGQFTTTTPEAESGDELGDLAAAIRLMRGRLGEMSGQLVRALRMESLNILGSILVHDMKNLSFRLRCLSQNLAANHADPAFRESLTRALNDSTEQMDQMVRRFREEKEMIIIKIRADINQIVRNALGNLRRDADGIQIHEEYGNLPPVWADTMLIENALFNIVENARDAMPRGGQLYIRTRFLENSRRGAPQAVVDIADTGPGMSEEFIQTDLFAPFVTTKTRGLGLGLYTSRRIIQMHDGEIKVRSEIGRGTVFSIYLTTAD